MFGPFYLDFIDEYQKTLEKEKKEENTKSPPERKDWCYKCNSDGYWVMMALKCLKCNKVLLGG